MQDLNASLDKKKRDSSKHNIALQVIKMRFISQRGQAVFQIILTECMKDDIIIFIARIYMKVCNALIRQGNA